MRMIPPIVHPIIIPIAPNRYNPISVGTTKIPHTKSHEQINVIQFNDISISLTPFNLEDAPRGIRTHVDTSKAYHDCPLH